MFEGNPHDTLVEILQFRAAQQPDKKAYTFLSDGEQVAGSLTFHDLDRQARIIAARLQSVSGPGTRALLMYPSGLEYVSAFLGCLYAGFIAVPVYPPRPNQNLDRFLSIVNDCQPGVVLSIAEITGTLDRAFGERCGLEPMRLIDTDKLVLMESSSAVQWKKPEISPNTIAFLQYTSGSTSKPRGVMVSHGNLMHNQRVLKEMYEHTEDTVLVSWLPVYHDMGLIGTILPPIYSAGHCVFMSPAAFIQRPARWLEAFSRYQGTFTAAPNFAYDLCVGKVTAEQKKKLDLSTWRVGVNGAEPVRANTVRAFVTAFAECGLQEDMPRPSYGLAEGTLVASSSGREAPVVVKAFDASFLKQNRVVEVPELQENSRVLVSCGHGSCDQKIAIVDPDTLTACPSGEVGEIWLASPSVAQGYWNQPELTKSTFQACIAGSGEGPFLRTGDLGFLHQGELYITGRRKDLIIIRGQNHYPQDIEFTIERSHPAVRPGCGAAFSVESEDGDRVVVVYEIKPSYVDGLNLKDLTESIREAVAAAHELQIDAIEFVKPQSIPKTSSGKIQRGRCREKFLAGDLDRLQGTEMVTGHSSSAKIAPATWLGAAPNRNQCAMQFSLFYFSCQDPGFQKDKYRLLLEGAKFADDHDFAAVWVPERHFHPFGGIYPNPSVLASALAVTTRRIRIRAGSVVLPLHSPIRVAEEWATVDNLSGGRVDLAFARGWNANDFTLAPSNYSNALQVLYQNLETVRKLWRGESITVVNGKGKETELRIYPLPQQRELPVWITCSGGVERFMEAGVGGWNVLTALLFQSLDDLSQKIAAYRKARARCGHDPATGHVTLMLHTFLGTGSSEVKQQVRGPLIEYLKSSVDLWKHGWKDLSDLTEAQRTEVLNVAFERYYQTGLFGTPESCLAKIEKLKQAGVNEIACLIDFGINTESALSGLRSLHLLQQKAGGIDLLNINHRPASPVAVATSGFQGGVEQPSKSSTLSGCNVEQQVETPVISEGEFELADRGTPDGEPLSHFMKQAITKTISKVTQIRPEDISPGKHFLALGINSLKGVEIMDAIQKQFAVRLRPSLLFEFPTVDRLAEVLVCVYKDRAIGQISAVKPQTGN